MCSEKASNSPGLCPVKGQKPSLGTQTRSLSVTKTSPPYPVLVNQPMSNPSLYSQSGRYHAKGCNSSVINYSLGESGHTPLYVGLSSTRCSMYGDHKFSLSAGDSERYK